MFTPTYAVAVAIFEVLLYAFSEVIHGVRVGARLLREFWAESGLI
jgi:hypothetical protein